MPYIGSGDITQHVAQTDNPHSVNKTQVGLGNVDNTSDLDKPISTATQNALDLKGSISLVEGSQPPTGTLGQFWIHETTDVLRYYDGSGWITTTQDDGNF